MPGALNDLVRFFLQHWPCLSADKYNGIPGRPSLQKVPSKFTDLRRILKYFFHQRRDYWHSKSHWNIMIQSMKLCSRSKMISQIDKIICQSYTKTFFSCCFVLIDEHLAYCFKPNELMQHLILYPLTKLKQNDRCFVSCCQSLEVVAMIHEAV